MFSKMLRLGSFPFMVDDSTPILNVSSAGLILLMLVHNQHRKNILAPCLQTEECLGGTGVGISLLQWLDHQRSVAFSLNGRAERN